MRAYPLEAVGIETSVVALLHGGAAENLAEVELQLPERYQLAEDVAFSGMRGALYKNIAPSLGVAVGVGRVAHVLGLHT